MKVVGLVGQKQHGKDTVYAFIEKHLQERGQKVERFAFADPLKQEVAGVLGLQVPDIERDKHRFRGMLQWWGTEWRRGQDLNYWISQTRKALEAAEARGVDVAVVVDCRFLNEAALINEIGGQLWRVERPGFMMGDNHASETEMARIVVDTTLMNDGTLVHLEREVIERLPLVTCAQPVDLVSRNGDHRPESTDDRGVDAILRDAMASPMGAVAV
jgi:hypothetical protein